MRVGIFLIVVSVGIFFLISKLRVTKDLVKQFGLFLAISLFVYGIILIIQPNSNSYVKYTDTTIEKK